MCERTFDMPPTWEDTGKLRSAGPFLWAYVVPGSAPPAKPSRKRGPRTQPKSIQLPGTRALDSRGRRVVDIAPKTNGMSVTRAQPSPFRTQSEAA